MEEYRINRILVSAEAKFDYALIFNLLIGDFGSDLPPKFQIEKEIRDDLEIYIDLNRKLWNKNYFKATYIHEQTGKHLMFFIRKTHKFESMQIWHILGICEVDEYSEELEEIGQYRVWYDTKVDDLPRETDWVEKLYRNKMLEILNLIYDIGGRDGYIRACQGLIEELSSKYEYDKIDRITVRGVKYFIKSKHWDSETANAIIEILNRLLEREREEADWIYFHGRPFTK